MEKHFTLTDEQFELQFQDATLEPQLFTHEAHIRLAWIHLDQYGVEQAIQNVTSQLKNYVKVLGASDKYNETLTIAAIKAVHHFYLRSPKGSFQDFILINHRLKENFKELMYAHYSTHILSSEYAKMYYIEPELIPFD